MNYSELIDVKEENLKTIDSELLNILLTDHTTNKKIIWATDIYNKYGYGYSFKDFMTCEKVTGLMKNVIKPRVKKTKEEKEYRIKDKAEVFTPSWMCNIQNNQIDEVWFGIKNVFNTHKGFEWTSRKGKIVFKDKTWQDYVEECRMEISCGEAPYLVSRYDTVTGKVLKINDRIGLLDRKIRVINENVDNLDEWIEWIIKAYKSIYGFEWQGDSLLIARENLLYTFTDNYKYKFKKKPSLELVKKIAEIISWNIWQMDGIKYVIPESCNCINKYDYTLFGDILVESECIGCKKGNINKHNGKYAKVMNWDTNRPIKFITLMNRSMKNGK